MTTAIAKTGTDYTREQIDTIKQTVAKGANDSQLALFLQVCKSRGLDPFTKQVYFTPQGIIVSIDGLRAIAERTGTYAPGPTRYEYDQQGGLVAAYVTVRKLVAGTWFDLEESAFYEEYRGTSPIWKRMPRVMLAKTAESRALRRGWSSELSGLYEQSEMDQAQRDERPVHTVQAVVVPDNAGDAWEPPVERSAAYTAAANALAEASTMDALKAVAARITAAKDLLSADERESLRLAYTDKRNAIGGGK